MLRYATGMVLGFMLLAIVCNVAQLDTLLVIIAFQQSAGSVRVIPMIQYPPIRFKT